MMQMLMMILYSSSRSEVDYLVQDGLKLRVVQVFGENVRQLICCLDIEIRWSCSMQPARAENGISCKCVWSLTRMLWYLIAEELPCCPRTSAQKKTGEALIRSKNQTDIRLLCWRMLVRYTPICMTRVQSPVVSSTTGCFVELHVTGPPANMYK